MEDLMKDQDPCFQLEKNNLEINYNKYMDLLKAIPDKDKEDQQQGNQSQVQIAIRTFLQQQDVRLEGVRKVIEDVETAMNGGAEPTTAYCRLKLKALQDSWGRFQTSNEERLWIGQTYQRITLERLLTLRITLKRCRCS